MAEISDSEQLNRRLSPRYPCMGAAEILQSGKRWGWGKVSDISRCGCYIETDHPLPNGTEAQLRLTIADMLLDICAKVVSTTPVVGMGMEFTAVPDEQENKFAQILHKITATDLSPAVQQAGHPQPRSATIEITKEAAPGILAKIIKRINEKGVLTRQELIDIVKANKQERRKPRSCFHAPVR
jgi:PilZ domain